MSVNGKQIDLARFGEMRRRIPREELLPYAGKHVAFDGETVRVVASGEGYDELFKRLDELGIDISTVVSDYIPGPDEDTWL
jgi:hypothetical protein